MPVLKSLQRIARRPSLLLKGSTATKIKLTDETEHTEEEDDCCSGLSRFLLRLKNVQRELYLIDLLVDHFSRGLRSCNRLLFFALLLGFLPRCVFLLCPLGLGLSERGRRRRNQETGHEQQEQGGEGTVQLPMHGEAL